MKGSGCLNPKAGLGSPELDVGEGDGAGMPTECWSNLGTLHSRRHAGTQLPGRHLSLRAMDSCTHGGYFRHPFPEYPPPREIYPSPPQIRSF